MTGISTKLAKEIPNILSLLRIFFATFMNLYIINNFGSMLIPIITVSLIFLSDFLDGRIARFYKSTSKIGELLDILADFYYILVSCIVLWKYEIMSLWFLLIIIYKFIEFVITSIFLKRLFPKNSTFIFDFVGRAAAVIFYILPILVYASFCLSQNLYVFIINICSITIPFLVFTSTIYRIAQCISGKQRNLKLLQYKSMINN